MLDIVDAAIKRTADAAIAAEQNAMRFMISTSRLPNLSFLRAETPRPSYTGV